MIRIKGSCNKFLEKQKEYLKEAKKIDFVINLSFTDKEINDNLLEILSYQAQDKKCQEDNSKVCPIGGIHKCFYRDENNQLKTKTYVCDKQKQINEKQKHLNNFLYRDFSDKYLSIKFDKDHLFNIPENGRNNLIANLHTQLSQNHLEGYYVYGNIGVGKTYIMIAFANELINLNKTVCFLNFSDFCNELKANFSLANPETDRILNKINKFKNADVLIIDNLGQERFGFYTHLEVLLSILSYRFDNKLVTYFISNVSYEELFQSYRNNKDIIKGINKQNLLKLKDTFKGLIKKEIKILGDSLRY